MPPTIITPSSIRTAKFFQSSTSRKESLSLYREILRTTKAFHWCDERGNPWNVRLRQEARKEFEQSREEADPLIIARMLVTGRDCVQQIQAKFSEADRAAWSRIQDDSTRRGWWMTMIGACSALVALATSTPSLLLMINIIWNEWTNGLRQHNLKKEISLLLLEVLVSQRMTLIFSF